MAPSPSLHSNHSRTHTSACNSHSSSTHIHNLSTIYQNNTSIRFNMPHPPTPPPEFSPNIEEAPTGSSHHAKGSPGAPKLGAAPSFASVVSSTARSPLPALSTTPTKSQQQKQGHVQFVSASPPSLGNDNSGGSNIIAATQTMGAASPSTLMSLSSESHGVGITASDMDRHGSSDDGDSESSDVEILLDTFGLHDSAARMHVSPHTNSGDSPNFTTNSTANTPPLTRSNSYSMLKEASFSTLGQHVASKIGLGVSNANSGDPHNTKFLSHLPLPMSLSSSPLNLLSQQKHQFTQQPNQNVSSPRIPPPAPVHSTIPLPEMEDSEHGFSISTGNKSASGTFNTADARQVQESHFQQDAYLQQTESIVHGLQTTTIDLETLSLGSPQTGPVSAASTQGRNQFRIPTSQSQQPLPSVATPFLSKHTHEISEPATTSNNSAFHTSVSEPVLNSGAGATDPGANAGSGFDSSQKTPNVYINGLPPHYPEDELFSLASEFGPIRSVRTFTRHVRDSESGYGFVLFENIDDAEKCIIALRRFRNLHPTFSKQIHKIPGTSYAHPTTSNSSSWDELGRGSNSSSVEGSMAGDGIDSESASFKAKMESLHDPTSTNLYMEGLPLSIDEPTLSALVSPHRISSSRFFQTRLSNPPRIIAFVRLETRIGAEEVIERLHGRMVRGWNDTGSRISVRFADTSEQRELRRTERTTQEGDNSSARLTIAQAALLNLRGQDFRSSKSGPVIHAHGTAGLPSLTSTRGGMGFGTSISAPDFSSNANIPVIGSGSGIGGLEVDYSLAPGRSVNAGLGMGMGMDPRARSPYHQPHGLHYQRDQYACHSQLGMMHGSGLGHGSSVDPATVALLDSLRATGVPYRGGSGGYGDGLGGGDECGMQNQRMALQQQQLQHGLGGHQYPQTHQHQLHHQLPHLPMSQSLDNLQQYGRPTPAYTRSGYTATEEYIMRSHTERSTFTRAQIETQHQQQASAERHRPTPLDLRRRRMAGGGSGDSGNDAANIAVGVRGYRAHASLMSPLATSASLGSIGSMGMDMGASPMMMSEEDFHTGTATTYASDFRHGEVGRGVASSMHASASVRHPAHLLQGPVSVPATTSYQQQQVQRPMPLSPLIPSSNQDSTSSPNPNDGVLAYQHQHASAAHMRSTTLPQHRSSSVREREGQIQQQPRRVRGHYQHNSMSMPAQNLRTPQHASVAQLGSVEGVGSGPGGTIFENEDQEERHQHQQRSEGGGPSGDFSGRNTNGNNATTVNAQTSSDTIAGIPSKTQYPSSTIIRDMEQRSPISASSSLISPTLTYSSHTPSTLSPATPFFGSFNNQTEDFEKHSDGDQSRQVHQHKQQQQKPVVIAGGLSGGR